MKGVYDISETSYYNELGPQIEWTFSVTYPSFEGVYGPIVLSYVDGMGKSHVIQSGVDKMVKLACQWADLKDMDNADKIVSIVLYNYPPGKAEIGASFLDVFNSTYTLLFKLHEAGFDVGNISDIPSLRNLTDMIVNFGNKGSWAEGLLNDYVESHFDELMAHNQLIDLNQFYDLTAHINASLYEWMINRWGDGLGKIMVYKDRYILIPGMWFGNVFITFQPSRGWEEIQNYHDLSLPPHQQYVAFYEWLDQVVGHLLDAKTEGDVFINVEMREECVLLEYRIDRAFIGRDIRDLFTIKDDGTLILIKESAEDPEQGRLAAT